MADAIRVEGADALARALRQFPAVSKRELTKSNTQVARMGRTWGRGAAQRGTPQQAKMAGGIGSTASSKSASITVRNTVRAPGATSAFYGQKGKFGWYGNPRYRDSPPQGLKWVGSNWAVAVRGQGPYVLNPMLADKLSTLRRMYFAGQVEAVRRAARAAR